MGKLAAVQCQLEDSLSGIGLIIRVGANLLF
jgi:hypothetical protein